MTSNTAKYRSPPAGTDSLCDFAPLQSRQTQMPRLEDHCWTCSCAPSRGDSEDRVVAAPKAVDMLSIITAVLRGAYGSLHSDRAANLLRRGLVLFAVGVFLALVLNLLQIQRHVTLFPEEVMSTLFSSAWWIPPCCGTGAGEFITGDM